MKTTISSPASQVNNLISINNSSESLAASPEVVRDLGEGATPITCPPQVVNFGFDTVVIHYHVSYQGDSDIFSYLQNRKQLIQSGIDQEMEISFGKTEVFRWNLKRTGKKFMKYHLTTGDISLYLDDRSAEHKLHNMELHIGSLSCNQSMQETVTHILNWLKYLGFTVESEKVSRFDIFCDLKKDINKLGIENRRRHIARTNQKIAYYDGENLSSYYVGKGDVMLRIYDKQLEMKTKQNVEKILFFNKLWQTSPEENVTRFEYQIRRPVIKELFPESTTLQEISDKKCEVWRYLTEDWFRMTRKDVDRENKNQSQAGVAVDWLNVQDACSFRCPPAKRNRSQVFTNIPALIKQSLGCMVSVCAGLGLLPDDFFGIIAKCQEALSSSFAELMCKDREFKRKFIAKQNRAVITF